MDKSQAFSAMDPGSIPGWETNISWVVQQKEKKERKRKYMLCNTSEKNLKIIMLREINQTKDYILHDSIHMKCLERQNSTSREEITDCLELGVGVGMSEIYRRKLLWLTEGSILKPGVRLPADCCIFTA